MVVQDNLLLGKVMVPLEQVGPWCHLHVGFPTSTIHLGRHPSSTPQVLRQDPGVSHPVCKDRLTLFTGSRVVCLEMTKVVSNFINVAAGHRVMCKYRGMRRVCARCSQKGHFGTACSTPSCNRCRIFGHSTEGCTAPCKRWGHNHAMTDCMQCRGHSAVAQAVGPPKPVAHVTAAGTPPTVEKQVVPPKPDFLCTPRQPAPRCQRHPRST